MVAIGMEVTVIVVIKLHPKILPQNVLGSPDAAGQALLATAHQLRPRRKHKLRPRLMIQLLNALKQQAVPGTDHRASVEGCKELLQKPRFFKESSIS